MPLPSEAPFAAFLKYSPRGSTPASLQAKTITLAIKNDSFAPTKDGTRRIIPYTARRLAEELPNFPALSSTFTPGSILVPAPRSAPMVDGGFWPAFKMCQSLAGEGVATEVLPLLVRTRAVTKSATAGPGSRPTAEDHYHSLAINSTRPLLPERPRFVLVDDVVTRGATFLAGFARLREVFPASEVMCFAVVRTMSGVEIDAIVEPVRGLITNTAGHIHREP